MPLRQASRVETSLGPAGQPMGASSAMRMVHGKHMVMHCTLDSAPNLHIVHAAVCAAGPNWVQLLLGRAPAPAHPQSSTGMDPWQVWLLPGERRAAGVGIGGVLDPTQLLCG